MECLGLIWHYYCLYTLFTKYHKLLYHNPRMVFRIGFYYISIAPQNSNYISFHQIEAFLFIIIITHKIYLANTPGKYCQDICNKY
jgi:hypothetical protein